MNTLSKMKQAPKEMAHPEATEPRRSKNAGFKSTLKKQMAEQKAFHDRLQQQKDEKIKVQQCQKTRALNLP